MAVYVDARSAPDNRPPVSEGGTQTQAGNDRGVSQQDGAHIHLYHARFHHLHELIHGREHLRCRRQSIQSNGQGPFVLHRIAPALHALKISIRLVFAVNEVSSESSFIPTVPKAFRP
jgi:hypothetical protein